MEPKPYPKIEGLVTYLQSLDWSEPWLYGLFVFYSFLFGGLYVFRRNSAIQTFSFVLMLLTVYMAEDLNEYFAHNHQMFTKHQYFDSSGLFISIVMSTPLLLASAFVVGNWFYVSSQLMTHVKILQIQKRQRYQSAMELQEQQQELQQQQQQQQSADPGTSQRRKRKVKKED